MGSVFLYLILCFSLILLPAENSVLTDNKSLVYKHCTNRTPENISSPHAPVISEMYQELLAKSTHSKFFTTIVGDDGLFVSGLFQCRHDLSPDECNTCVKHLSQMSKNLCGESVPARIHLSGCLVHYQREEIELSRIEMLHKVCSTEKVETEGFEELRYAGFAALGNGVLEGNGFCELRYESMHLMAECLGNLGRCECGECVNYAAEMAMDECKYSVSGEIYLDGCFITYEGYYGHSYKDGRRRRNSPKLVALVVGGLAALSAGVVLCYFLRSCGKKKEDW